MVNAGAATQGGIPMDIMIGRAHDPEGDGRAHAVDGGEKQTDDDRDDDGHHHRPIPRQLDRPRMMFSAMWVLTSTCPNQARRR